MTQNPNAWKSFYRNQYGDHWQQFSGTLAQQSYHVRYQEICLAPLLNLKGHFLEVGVGRGDLLNRMPLEKKNLFGCDLSERNISGAKDCFQNQHKTVYLCQADAEELPYSNNSFDAVYSLSVLWYLPDYRQAIREMFRVAKPGGLVLFDMLNRWHITSLSNHLWRKICRMGGRELGRTTLASPASLYREVKPLCGTVHMYGNYILLPAGLPILKEKGNWCRLVPSLAYRMTESPLQWLAHKLVVVARKK